MEISFLSEEDCGKAAYLHQKAFERGWEEHTFKTFLQDPLIVGLKLEENNELQGYLLWRDILDEAEIITFVIAVKHQRMGKGGVLLRYFFDHLREKGVKRICLEVAEDNDSAIEFYRNYGFVFFGKRPHYYPRKVNIYVSALNFCKNLV